MKKNYLALFCECKDTTFFFIGKLFFTFFSNIFYYTDFQ